MSDCEKLEKCPFFIKYEGSPEFKTQGFKNLYCTGPLQSQCARIDFKAKTGAPPSENLSPSGVEFC
ncbi:MAG: hypothetical protein C0621_05260 [Desulfuromonas sp.]|nr:MAG: hypothetical protein C0621_05260 [Desulfuromonas sp.]